MVNCDPELTAWNPRSSHGPALNLSADREPPLLAHTIIPASDRRFTNATSNSGKRIDGGPDAFIEVETAEADDDEDEEEDDDDELDRLDEPKSSSNNSSKSSSSSILAALSPFAV